MGLKTNISSYYACIGDLIADEQVQSMKAIRHHFWSTCYDHSVFVSYVAFRLARRLGADYVAAARAGLLHDLFLYDPRDKSTYEGTQCFAHPKAALKNAAALCGDLSHREENSILTHMWPLAPKMPRYKEAFIVNLADKACAIVEVCNLYGIIRRKNRVPVPA
ncbi:MAG: HD domain-containing protein [Clostridiales bacterium]|nr:HD domain-containing protein [Clostridiales bacterium]